MLSIAYDKILSAFVRENYLKTIGTTLLSIRKWNIFHLVFLPVARNYIDIINSLEIYFK